MTTTELKAGSRLPGTRQDLHLSWLVRHPKRAAVSLALLLMLLFGVLVWQQQQKNIEVER